MLIRKVCVMGGTGFVGRHLAAQLVEHGCHVKILTRARARHTQLLVLPRLSLVEANVHDPHTLAREFHGCDVVVNLVAILNERGHRGRGFRQVHVELTRKVLAACQDAGVTRVGDDNWIMAYVHLAHDCQVASHAIFANYCGLAGHVHVGDWAILGGMTLVHQFVHIGAHSFTGMGTYLPQDLPPYVTAAGNTAKPYGINSEGLRRRGFAPEAIAAVKQAYRTLYRSGLGLDEARHELETQAARCPEVQLILDFLARSTRGIIR